MKSKHYYDSNLSMTPNENINEFYDDLNKLVTFTSHMIGFKVYLHNIESALWFGISLIQDYEYIVDTVEHLHMIYQNIENDFLAISENDTEHSLIGIFGCEKLLLSIMDNILNSDIGLTNLSMYQQQALQACQGLYDCIKNILNQFIV